MSDTVFKKVLGVADYEAKWVQRSNLVRLRAVGILPCSNYEAQLEQRPERVIPPMWSMAFLIQDICLTAVRPFVEERFFPAPPRTKSITVFDAVGENQVELSGSTTDSIELVDLSSASDRDEYNVYARVVATDGPPSGCIVVPADAVVIAIYYCVFGPATKAECDAYVAKNCDNAQEIKLRGGEVPWPLLE